MPHNRLNFKGSKKRPVITSVDGFVPKRQRPVVSPQYYRKEGPLSGGPRRPLAKRRTLNTETLEIPAEEVDDTPKLGGFDQPESDVFRNTYPDRTATQLRGSRKRRSKDQKEKKPGRLRSWWKKRSLKFKLGLACVVVLLGLSSMLGIRLYSFLNSVFGRGVGNSKSAALSGDIDPSQLNTEGDGRLNILLMGRGGSENEAPDATDTLMIASVDLKNQNATLLSIPRDTYVGNKSDNTKINGIFGRHKTNAMARGAKLDDAENEAIKAVISAIRDVAGVPIHKYVLTDYKAFRDVVNALGGVDVTVPEPLYDNFTGWRFKAGRQVMNGDKALQYARTRHSFVNSDFGRTENQRRLLVAMRNKATSTGIVANPIRLNSLANAVQKNIRTDLSIDEAKTVFDRSKQITDSKIQSLNLNQEEDPLMGTGMVNGQSIVRPTEGLQDYTKIRAYARSNMIDPYLKKEGPKVAVYNGSGRTGLATIVGDVMAGYGYKVLAKETSASTQNKTLVIRMNKSTKRPFTERFLSVRFGTVITSSLPSGIVPAQNDQADSAGTSNSANSTPQPDYIIVLGTNFRTPSGPTW